MTQTHDAVLIAVDIQPGYRIKSLNVAAQKLLNWNVNEALPTGTTDHFGSWIKSSGKMLLESKGGEVYASNMRICGPSSSSSCSVTMTLGLDVGYLKLPGDAVEKDRDRDRDREVDESQTLRIVINVNDDADADQYPSSVRRKRERVAEGVDLDEGDGDGKGKIIENENKVLQQMPLPFRVVNQTNMVAMLTKLRCDIGLPSTDIEEYLLSHPDFAAEVADSQVVTFQNAAVHSYFGKMQPSSLAPIHGVVGYVAPVYRGALSYSWDTPLIHLDGSPAHCRFHAIVAEGHEEKRDRVFIFAVDISSFIDEIESERNAIVLAKAQARFVASVGHDLRTPLQTIIGCSQILEKKLKPEGPEAEDNSKALIEMSDAVEILKGLISNVLDFSRAEEGHPLISESTEFSLIEICEQVCRIVQRQAPADVSITVQIEDGVPSRVSGDPVRIQQVLLNIVGNAANHARLPDGELNVKLRVVEVSNSKMKLRLRFEIVDDGVGISPGEQQQMIFRPFYRVSDFQGTGLGLAVSKSAIEAMGGEISVHSEGHGKGSTFWFELPFETDTDTTVSDSMAEGMMVESTHTQHQPLRILVVDDNIHVQTIMKLMIESLDHHCIICPNGRTCLEMLEADDNFNAVLLDLLMPQMNGIEVSQAIREREGDGRIGKRQHITALTATVESGVRQKCLVEGKMDDYVSKPVSLETLDELFVAL